MIRINLASLNDKYEPAERDEDAVEYELTITLGDTSARVSLRRGASYPEVIGALRQMAAILEETA